MNPEAQSPHMGRYGRDRMLVGLMNTFAISSYHH